MKIMLDPGHGREKRGFLDVSGFLYSTEGEANFIFCQKFKRELEALGFEVGMTRTSLNDNPSLKTRGNMGKGYDLLISSHTNAGGGTGVEIWDSTNPAESIKPLTDAICETASRVLGIPNRGTKYKKNNAGQNWYGILRHGQAKHNFIVEWCFHDKRSDVESYVAKMDLLAKEAAKTIGDYFKVSKPVERPKENKPIIKEDKPMSKEDFIEMIYSHLKGKRTNIFNSVTIAQAILETGWGKSELARKANNYFGIKADARWSGLVYQVETKEQKPSGEIYKIYADFRAYESIADSIKDHDEFFVSSNWRKENYKKVLEAKDPFTQARALRSCGYATNLDYADKLINIIKTYGLTKYDAESTEDAPSDWALESWDWGKENKITDGTNPKGFATREEIITMMYRNEVRK